MGDIDHGPKEPILDDDVVYRRIPHKPSHVKPSGEPTSACFSDHPNGTPMSANLGSDLEGLGHPPESVLANYPGYLLVQVSVRVLRELGLDVRRHHVDGNPGHVEIVGDKTKQVKRAIAKAAVWLVGPQP